MSRTARDEGHVILSQQEEGGATPTAEEQGFSHFIAVCFTINYIVGTGFLTLPWAFQQGGVLLSTFTLVFVVFVSNITKNYLLQSMALAEALHEEERQDVNHHSLALQIDEVVDYGSASDGSDSTEDEQAENGRRAKDGLFRRTTLSGDHVVKNRKFEVLDLVRLYLGSKVEKLLIVTIALDVSMELWAFTSVFSSSFAEELPVLHNFTGDYNLYTALFAVVVVPLSCLELKEQVAFQITLSTCRFLVILLMLITTVMAMASNDRVYFTDVSKTQGADLVRFRGFYEMFSVMFYTTQFHLSVPVLSHAVRDKRQLGPIFRDALVVCMVAFGLLGVVLACFFGNLVEQSANLHWNTLVGEGWWAKATSAFILCFPAINVLSAYPLNAILLGNNLMALVYGTSLGNAQNNRLVRILFRFMAAVPPILGALVVRQLGIITSFAGLFGAVSALPIPALMCLKSRQMATQKGLHGGTHYDSVGSADNWAKVIFVASLLSMLFILVNLIVRQ